MRGLSRIRVALALDARSVARGTVRGGLLGKPATAVASDGLAEGALLPSAFERNLVKPDEVRRALREVMGPAPSRGAVVLVLPHGVARLAVLDLPRGAEVREYARFRLAASEPRFASDALIDFLPLDRGRVLAAAVRREVVTEYEEAAAAAGIDHGRVDLAPLAAAASVLRQARSAPSPSVAVVLGDVACLLMACEGGRVLAVRTRRRDLGRGEAERLRLDALRTALAAGMAGEPELLFAGSGARGVLDHLAAAGRAARLLFAGPEAGPLPEAGSRPWLAAALS
jgi:hypothetical protein